MQATLLPNARAMQGPHREALGVVRAEDGILRKSLAGGFFRKGWKRQGKQIRRFKID